MAVLSDQTPPGVRGVGDGGGRASAPLTVTLTYEEIVIASFVGVRRRALALCKGLRPVNNAADDADMQIDGAMAEMAVAKLLDKYFPNDFKTDISHDIEVRTTRHPNGCLIVRQNDSDAKRYVLVICETPKFHIIGWVWGSDAKRPEYWRAPNGRPGAYFVPQSALKSFL